jgi:tRNA(His) 5'-end guanylyltransferase
MLHTWLLLYYLGAKICINISTDVDLGSRIESFAVIVMFSTYQNIVALQTHKELFVMRVCANLRKKSKKTNYSNVRTMNFWRNRMACSNYWTILWKCLKCTKVLKDLCTLRFSQHKGVAHCKLFEICKCVLC